MPDGGKTEGHAVLLNIFIRDPTEETRNTAVDATKFGGIENKKEYIKRGNQNSQVTKYRIEENIYKICIR